MMMKKKILIVASNPQMRRDFQASLIEPCPQWEWVLAGDGRKALEILDREEIDALITESKLRDQEGTHLLKEVMKLHPRTLRFLVVDLANQQAIWKSLGAAHQFLARPCDTLNLSGALERAFALDVWLPNESVAGLLARLPSLPSPPTLYFQVVHELQSAAASLQKIGAMIARDPAMTAKILQLANSTAFGLQQPVTQPAEAVLHLGIETTKSMILLAHTYSYFDQFKGLSLLVEDLWLHSMATGRLARRIAQHEVGAMGTEVAEEAGTAGMLHDIGKLALAANLPQPYQQARALARHRKLLGWETEREYFGTTHAEVGACLLAVWGLPVPIVEAVALHHLPAQLVHTTFCPLTAVHVANVFDHAVRPGDPNDLAPQVDLDYLKAMGLEQRLPVWRDLGAKSGSGKKE
jgi:HD-like signal output (HDOD) protein